MRVFERTGLRVENLSDSRFTEALEFFVEGKTLEFEDTVFVLNRDRRELAVMKIARCEIREVSTERASAEILRAQDVYQHICRSSMRFAEVVDQYSPRFSVIIDYGMGAVEVCHLRDDKLVWKPNA